MARNIDYSTPQWLFDALNAEFHFTIDACGLPHNAKCPRFWSPEQDGLRQDWAGETPWWNPPFDDVSGWVHKAHNEAKDNGVTSVGLVPFRRDQYWFQLALESAQADVVIVDADQGWDGLFPWPVGTAPMPLIALLQSEAPGRIAWAIAHGVRALIAKPIAASAVYPALVMATSLHAERQATVAHIARLEERVRLRPLVHGAVQALQNSRRIDEDAAYSALRRAAMARRLTLEQIAADIEAGGDSATEFG